MMNDGRPTESDIFDALQVSGYLMEQEVATEFESLGFKVRTGAACADHETGQPVSREIDVLATIEQCCWNEPGGLQVSTEFICECKNNRDPLVFLVRSLLSGRSHPMSMSPEEFLFPIQNFEIPLGIKDGVRRVTIHGASYHLEFDNHHYLNNQPYIATQVCKVSRISKAKWEANNAETYRQMFLPVVKQMIYRRDGHARWIRAGWPNYVYLFFPMVVVNGPMYAVDVLANPLQVRQIEHIHYQRELDSPVSSGVFGVDFVTRNHVQRLVKESVQPFIDQVCALAMSSPERFLEGVDADKRRQSEPEA